MYSNLPDNKQMIVLSATYPPYMATYVTRYMRSATFVRLNIVDPSLRGIKQFYKLIPYNELKNVEFDSKVNELIKLLSSIQFKQCIVFTNYQIRAENLCQKLTEKGWPAIFIAGNIEQSKRNKAILQLKQFKCRILVSTDLVSYLLIGLLKFSINLFFRRREESMQKMWILLYVWMCQQMLKHICIELVEQEDMVT